MNQLQVLNKNPCDISILIRLILKKQSMYDY